LRSNLKRLKKKINDSDDARALAENFVSLTALKVLGYIFPLLTLPYLARVIGVDKFGEIAFAAAIIVYFQTLVEYGFNYTAVREIARNKNDIRKISEIFSTVMTVKFLLILVSFSLLTGLVYIFPEFYKNRLLIFLTFLYIPGYVMFPDWFFQAIEKMKYITVMNLVSKAVFTLLVFVVIKVKSDYIYQPVLIAFGTLLSGVISIGIILVKFKVKILIPSVSAIVSALKSGWNMFITLFLPNLYTNFSIILIKFYGGATGVGLYSSGYKFIDLTDQFQTVLSRTFYPFLARRIDKHKLFVMVSGAISIVAGIVLLSGAGLLVKIFYTAEFAESAKVIRIMAITPFFIFLMNTYGPNYLALIGKERLLRNIVIICSLGGFILSWIIVPRYSYLGVAITITIVWGIRGLLTRWFAVRSGEKSVSESLVI
jgi:O-antigen/teichoic acid export membrane protein